MSPSRHRRLRAAACFVLAFTALPALADDGCRARDYGMGYHTQLADQQSGCIAWFSEGLAPIVLDGREGYLDRDGHLAIEPQFGWARAFVHGRAAADDTQGKTGYIDTRGEWIIPPRFVAGENFNAQGTAVVRLEGYRQALIDRDGTVIRETGPGVEIEVASPGDPFPAGLAKAKRIRPDLLVHLDGRVLTVPAGVSVAEYDAQAKLFKGGQQVGQEFLTGLLDARLRWVGAPRFRTLSAFNGETAAASVDGEGWGLIDARGVERLPFRYASIRVAAPGLWLATDKHGGRLIDGRGKPVAGAVRQAIEQPFGDWFVHLPDANTVELVRADGSVVRRRFAGAIGSVEVRGRLLEVQLHDNGEEPAEEADFIDPAGRRLLPAVLAALRDDKRRFVLPMSAEQAQAGDLPLALLQNQADDGTGLGIVTASGAIRTESAWQAFAEGSSYDARERVVVRTASGYGAIDGEGGWAVQPIYAQLSGFEQGWARAEREQRQFLVRRDGREFPVPAFGDETPSDGLYLLVDEQGDQPWGPVNAYDLERQRFVFERGFDELRPFRGGLAPAKVGELWGLVDRQGQWRIAPAYRDIEAFGMRFWKAQQYDEARQDNVTSLLTGDGKRVTAEPWLTIYSNHDSHSGFMLPDGLPQDLVPRAEPLVLEDGTALSTVMVEDTSPIGGGWSKVSLKKMEGFVDARGDWAIPPRYTTVDNFSPEQKVARVYDGQRYALIDVQGRTVFGPADDFVSEVSADGMFYVHDKQADRTTVHKLGEGERFRLPGVIHGDFGDGLFSREEGDWETQVGFAYDGRGRKIVEAKGARLSSYADGLALRQDARSKRFEYVDGKGAPALPGRYIYATAFRDGRAVVMDEQGFRLIDRQGKTLVRVGEACGREVLLDAAGKQTWPQAPSQECVPAGGD